jgi:DNA-binding transcriptional LysR family regulator
MVNLNAVNLNRLVIFKAVVDAGSLTAAAERLGLAKTAVSKHMQLLEAEIGVNLLVRSTRKHNLTEAGQAFYEASSEILKNAEEAILLARTGLDMPRGTLRVAAPIDYGAMVIAPILVELRERHPSLKVELICHDHFVDLIAEGIDVAVRLGKLADSSIGAARVGSFVKWLVASPQFVAAHGIPDTLETLAELPYIALTVLPQPFSFMLEGPNGKKSEVQMAAPGFSTNTAYACHAAALAGGGVALLTDFSVNEDIEAGRLVRLLPEWAAPTADIHALFPPTRHRQAKVQVFIDALKTTASNVVAR